MIFSTERSVLPLKDEQGNRVGWVSVVRDITVRKRLEEHLRQSQKIEAVGRLAGGIAHDFNNLLTAILGYSEMIMMAAGHDEELEENILEIKKSAERAASLTQQLLAFSRKQVLQTKVFNLNELLISLEKMLRRLIRENIELSTNLDPELAQIEADPGQLEQVILNLAVNAHDAMPKGGRLAIETRNVYLDEDYCREHRGTKPGNHVLLAVSDTGCGMDEKTKIRIFEPFFTTKEMGKGTGLGLSTVYGIVKQSGGFIWVYSEPDRGTTFKIYLPRSKKADEKYNDTIGEIRPQGGSETILIVEDEDAVRKMTRKILKSLGYNLIEAENGAEALKISIDWKEKKIDLLLTDIVMPEMSGPELSEQLLIQHPKMKVLYMSGYTEHTITGHGVLGEGASFLEKPFSFEDLAQKVRGVLDEG